MGQSGFSCWQLVSVYLADILSQTDTLWVDWQNISKLLTAEILISISV